MGESKLTIGRSLAVIAAAVTIAGAQAAWAQSRSDEPRRAAPPARAPAAAASRPVATAHQALKATDGRAQYTARSAKALPDSVINTAGVARGRALIERDGTIMLDTKAPATESLVFSGKLDLRPAAAAGGAPAVPGAGSIIFRGSFDPAAAPAVPASVVLIVGDSHGTWWHREASSPRPLARDVFPTNNVSRQIDYGFPGAIGPLPAYPHKVQKSGVSLPD